METCVYTARMPRKAKKPTPRPALGRHLAALRQAAGLTQTELSVIVGVSQANIAFWERSAKPPRSDVLESMAQALGVSVEALLHPAPSGESPKARSAAPRGHGAELFEAVKKLPRRQQRRIFDVLEALLSQFGADSDNRAA